MNIILFDLSWLFWSIALGPSGSTDPDAAFGQTLGRIRQLADGFHRVVFACDSGPSFRYQIDKDYKKDRKERPAYLWNQLRALQERLDADGHHVLIAPPAPEGGHLEGDDLIACVAQWWMLLDIGENSLLQIVSGDSDLGALVNDYHGITLKRLTRGEWVELNEAGVEAWVGVRPSMIVEFKALAGDDGDKYHPFPGVGPVKAKSLLARYSTAAEAVVACMVDPPPEGIPPAVVATLRKGGAEAADRGLALAKLRTDVEVDCSVILTAREPRPLPTGKRPERREEKPAPTPPPVPPTSTALVVPEMQRAEFIRDEARTALNPFAFQPGSMADLWDASEAIHNSRLFAAKFKNPAQIVVVGMEARERGIPLMTALRNAYVVHDQPAWSAAFLAGLVISSGKAKRFRIVETTPERAVLEYQRVDDDRPNTFTFTFEEAQKAGWVKGASKWSTNPRTMCRWAAIREAARAFFPDVVSGMYTPDELREGRVLDGEIEDEEAA